MEELFNLILNLLRQHACVIVPGLGGFVVNEESASCTVDGGNFVPPMRQVYFNHLLSHNDGLLVQEYMKKGMTFEEANERVHRIVEEIKSRLKEKKSLPVGDWGVFVMSGKRLVFSQGRPIVENKCTFGLSEFYFPLLTFEKKDNLETESQTVTKKSFFYKPLVMGVVVAVVLLMFFQPLQRKEMVSMASFQPTSMLMANLQNEVDEQTKRIGDLQKQLDCYQRATEGYYWVVADFTTEKEAQQYLFANQRDDYEMEVISVKGKYYISLFSGETKEELLGKRDDLNLQDGMFEDGAYILSVTRMKE